MSAIDDAIEKYDTFAAGELTDAVTAKLSDWTTAFSAATEPDLDEPAKAWHKLDGDTYYWNGEARVDYPQWTNRADWLSLYTHCHCAGFRNAGATDDGAVLRDAGVFAVLRAYLWTASYGYNIAQTMLSEGWSQSNLYYGNSSSNSPCYYNGELLERCLIYAFNIFETQAWWTACPDIWGIDLDNERDTTWFTGTLVEQLGETAWGDAINTWDAAFRAVLDATGLSHVKLFTDPAALVLPCHDICCGWTLVEGNEASEVDRYVVEAQTIMGDNQLPIVFGCHTAYDDDGTYKCHDFADVKLFLERSRLLETSGFATWDNRLFVRDTGVAFEGYDALLAGLADYQADMAAGPYAVEATEVFCPGAKAAEVFTPGAKEAEVFCPGAIAGEFTRS